jgi:hypothetical protein
MNPAARAWTIAAALIGALASAGVYAQRTVTERDAATSIYYGFLHDAAHAILSRDVKLGPELRHRLDLPQDADSRKIYDALVALTDKKKLVVRRAGPDDLSRYASRDLKQPLFTLEAGDTTFLIQYDLAADNIPFVGQLAGPAEPAVARKPAPAAVVEPPKPIPVPEPPKAVAIPPEPPKPVSVPEPPKPVAAPIPVAAPKPAAAPKPVAAPKPNGPCEVKPVMSNQDLVNCGATPP